MERRIGILVAVFASLTGVCSSAVATESVTLFGALIESAVIHDHSSDEAVKCQSIRVSSNVAKVRCGDEGGYRLFSSKGYYVIFPMSPAGLFLTLVKPDGSRVELVCTTLLQDQHTRTCVVAE